MIMASSPFPSIYLSGPRLPVRGYRRSCSNRDTIISPLSKSTRSLAYKSLVDLLLLHCRNILSNPCILAPRGRIISRSPPKSSHAWPFPIFAVSFRYIYLARQIPSSNLNSGLFSGCMVVRPTYIDIDIGVINPNPNPRTRTRTIASPTSLQEGRVLPCEPFTWVRSELISACELWTLASRPSPREIWGHS
jgi:hypothetical protein